MPILYELLRKFWEQEGITSPKHMSVEEQYCEQLYANTSTRDTDGRYVVRLAFKKKFPAGISLGSSRTLALKQYSYM